MLENRNSVSSVSPSADTPHATSESGFRGFNRVGREDTADELLRPQAPPGLLMRRVVMIAVVALLLAVVGYLAFNRSHLALGGGESSGPNFTPPTQQSDN